MEYRPVLWQALAMSQERPSLPDSSTKILRSRTVLLNKKKAGENVPGTWKPSSRKTKHLIPWAARKLKRANPSGR